MAYYPTYKQAYGLYGGGATSVATPTNLRTTSTTSSTATLAWDGGPGTFTLERALVTNGVAGAYSAVYTGAAKVFSDGGLAFQSTYAWRVKVAANGAVSPYSAELTLTIGSVTRYLLNMRGDSIVKANQAADEGGFPTDTGTTSVQQAQGTTGNVGGGASVEQAVAILNAIDPSIQFDCNVLGYPGLTAGWFNRNRLPTAFAGMNLTPYAGVFELLAWGANDPVYPDGSDSPAPVDVAAAIKFQAQQLKANSKVQGVLIVPALNRDNYPEFVNFEVARYQLNQLNYKDSYYAEVVNVEAQPVGQDGAPTGPVPNATFYDLAGHPNRAGQGQIGLEIARAIARKLGLTLSQGNGTRPVAQAAATLSITPASGDNTVARAATVTASGTYTLAELFRVNDAGLTSAPALVGSDSSAPFVFSFTPSATGRYYARLTKPDGSFVYTYPNPAVSVTNPVPQPSATISMNPNPAADGAQRTLSTMVANNPGIAEVQYYRQSSPGSSDFEVIGGVLTVAPYQLAITPLNSDAKKLYYARVKQTNNTIFFSDTVQAQFGAVGGTLIFEDVNFSYPPVSDSRRYFTAQDANGVATKSGGDQASFSGQLSASRRIPGAYSENSGVEWFLLRPRLGQAGSINGLQTTIPQIGQGGTDKVRYGLYSDEDKYFIINSGAVVNGPPTNWDAASTAMWIRIKRQGTRYNYYLVETDIDLATATAADLAALYAALDTAPVFGFIEADVSNPDVIPAASAAVDGTIIPKMQVFAYQLADSGV